MHISINSASQANAIRPVASAPGLVSVIVPTYKEAENISLLLPRIFESMREADLKVEVIIVDDDSGDGIEEIVERFTAGGNPVQLIVRVGERGLSSAVIRGFKESKGEIFVCMDADLSHPPEAIPLLLKCFSDPSMDFAIGSRYVPGASTDEDWGLFRWLNSKVATLLARPFTSAKDPMSGFFAIRRSVFERAARLNPIGYKIGLELVVKCNCKKICEIPIHFADRKFGESKLHLREQINYIKHLKRLADFKYREFSRFVQFCLVGLTGMFVDLTMIGMLLRLQIKFWLARAIAIWVAMTWNFFLNRRLTFSYSRDGDVFQQYWRFVASCAFGATISWSISVGLVEVIPILETQVYIAAILGIVAGTVFNFLLSRYWVFKRYKLLIGNERDSSDNSC